MAKNYKFSHVLFHLLRKRTYCLAFLSFGALAYNYRLTHAVRQFLISFVQTAIFEM